MRTVRVSAGARTTQDSSSAAERQRQLEDGGPIPPYPATAAMRTGHTLYDNT